MYYNNLGAAYNDLEDITKAETNLRKAIEVNSKNSDAYNNLGSLSKKKGDYKNAINFFEKSIELQTLR